MHIPILIDPISDGGFRASTGAPLELQAEAPSRDEAVDKLRQLIERRIAAGSELAALSIDGTEHPLARFAGIFKDEPLLQEWKDAMAEYRRQADAN
ncbi:MAG: hypothetical protein KY475_09890 [Planctomycetes bacterium]|nr:hypothetical protein [Planctomycetota bacterium]